MQAPNATCLRGEFEAVRMYVNEHNIETRSSSPVDAATLRFVSRHNAALHPIELKVVTRDPITNQTYNSQAAAVFSIPKQEASKC